MELDKKTKNNKKFIVPGILLLMSLVGISSFMIAPDEWINWILKLNPIIWHRIFSLNIL